MVEPIGRIQNTYLMLARRREMMMMLSFIACRRTFLKSWISMVGRVTDSKYVGVSYIATYLGANFLMTRILK